MAKDPAFLFYPGDWLGGTMGMSFEQKGCYFELLMLQFNNDKFTESQAKQVLSVCFDHAWPTIKQKFETDGTFYWNKRLTEEKEKRIKFVESRRLSGLTPKDKKAHAKRTHKRTENENRNENKNGIDYESVVQNYHVFCPKMNKVAVMNDTRKGFVRERISEHGLEKLIDVFRIAGESDFLNGKNDKGWKADFEWIIRPTNFVKIMEGKYSNTTKQRVDGYY